MHTTFDRALSRATFAEKVPRRIRGAIALLVSRRTAGTPLTREERALRDALPRLFADPIGCADEVAGLVAQAMTATSADDEKTNARIGTSLIGRRARGATSRRP